MLRLDDRASDHLPPELRFFDANGATIRQVLGMRSGIPGLNEFTPEGGFYPAEQASTAVKLFRKLPEPRAQPGVSPNTRARTTSCSERSSSTPPAGLWPKPCARTSWTTRASTGSSTRSRTPCPPTGTGVESTPASLARWGYELYGGSVLSDASLREMTDFGGEWYGLGVMDLSSEYGALAVGHEGSSSAATCCSLIRLVALPEKAWSSRSRPTRRRRTNRTTPTTTSWSA